MVNLARAILANEDYRAKRCAVEIEGEFAFFYSPRNSSDIYGGRIHPKGKVPLEDAKVFAREVLNAYNLSS